MPDEFPRRSVGTIRAKGLFIASYLTGKALFIITGSKQYTQNQTRSVRQRTDKAISKKEYFCTGYDAVGAGHARDIWIAIAKLSAIIAGMARSYNA
ncbi:MAG: hypothetical protein EPN17_10875 [Methylobacter sp.]|nr:MAG: hypothetical protein EPN17_10875 [Methylobacter sp.]